MASFCQKFCCAVDQPVHWCLDTLHRHYMRHMDIPYGRMRNLQHSHFSSFSPFATVVWTCLRFCGACKRCSSCHGVIQLIATITKFVSSMVSYFDTPGVTLCGCWGASLSFCSWLCKLQLKYHAGFQSTVRLKLWWNTQFFIQSASQPVIVQ